MREITLIVGADHASARRKAAEQGLAMPNAPGSDVVWAVDRSRIQGLLPARLFVLEPCDRELRQLAEYRHARAQREPSA